MDELGYCRNSWKCHRALCCRIVTRRLLEVVRAAAADALVVVSIRAFRATISLWASVLAPRFHVLAILNCVLFPIVAHTPVFLHLLHHLNIFVLVILRSGAASKKQNGTDPTECMSDSKPIQLHGQQLFATKF